MKQKKHGDIYAFSERMYPLFFSIAICFLYHFYGYKLSGDIGSLLNAIVSLTSTVIGFLGVILTLLFSIRENPLLNFIMENEYYKNKLKSYFKAPIISGFALIICTIFMLSKISVKIDLYYISFILGNLKYMEFFLLAYFLFSSYRIINFVIKCAFKKTVDNTNENFPSDQYDDEDLKILREQCSNNTKI